MMIPHQQHLCPICNTEVEPSKYMSWDDFLWFRCSVCTGGWQYPYVPEVDRSEGDINATYNSYTNASSAFESVSREKAQWVLSNLDNDMAVLEIGPGLGRVAYHVTKARDDIVYHAIEPQKTFAALVGGFLPVVHSGSLKDALPAALKTVTEQKRQVLIFMDNSLEHIPYPHSVIQQVVNYAPLGARVLLEVPNEYGIRYRYRIQDLLRGYQKPPTFPGHINLFTRKALGAMFGGFGLPYKVLDKPLRRSCEIAYLMQSEKVPPLVRLALSALRMIPVDTWMGMPYWLRVQASIC